ncbi:MAG: glycosyltransferase [Bacteroidales bacterium]|nr:glycosyltransferase [Bacteroidales bacterium]MCM1147512.1 glycosyltransferase [Bacteroidales bacterium]MCM1206181.1 glycosyltransferase [Bacillota bacterium]MCM1509985.1 glycosyltransferase [Clostridium sp.]
MGQAARFVQMLQVAMGKTVETHIISGNISRAEFHRRTDGLKPDVIHIHGCWSLKAAIVEMWALNRNIPVVLSPHNGLSPKEIQNDFWKKKLPGIIAYQFLAVRKAMVLHVTSSQELDDVKQLGWKKRIALISEPAVNGDSANFIETFRALYQKVIDTARRNKLSAQEEQCMWMLLHASVIARHTEPGKTAADTTDAVAKALDPEVLGTLHKLSVHNWKNIQVYAIDHGIRTHVLSGAKALHIQPPVITENLPARFKIKSATADGSISDKERKILEAATDPDTLGITTDILYLSKMLNKNLYNKEWQSPAAIMLSLYERLMYTEYDEDNFLIMIKRLKAGSFCAGLMQILSERLHLSIGFMPLDPARKDSAASLHKKLNDFNIPTETT